MIFSKLIYYFTPKEERRSEPPTSNKDQVCACGKRVVLAFGAGVNPLMINSANDNEFNKISQDYFP